MLGPCDSGGGWDDPGTRVQSCRSWAPRAAGVEQAGPVSAATGIGPVETVVGRLRDVGLKPARCAGGWRSRCPAHEDRNPSLSVSEGDDGRALVKCHAGCSTDAVLAGIDLQLTDLFPVPGPPYGASPNGRGSPKEVACTYDYHDASGKLLFQTVRYLPKDFRQRRPDGKGGWVWKLGDAERVLYRLPSVIAGVAAREMIFITEGEKDADRLAAEGFVATTCPMGAGKWSDRYGEYLRSAEVVVLPDSDASGQTHADEVARALGGVAESVRVVALPGLPEKGDVSDWLTAGHTITEFLRVVGQTPVYRPDPSQDDLPELSKAEPPPSRGAVRQLVGVNANDITERPVDWEWRHRFVRAALNLVEGHPESGKTGILLDLVARLSAGAEQPDGARYPPRRVLIVGPEDALESVVRPRLRIAGADLSRIRLITGALSAGCDLPDRIVLPADLPLLGRELENFDLLYVDSSINDFADRGVRPGDDMAIRALLGGLHELARATGKTVIATRHGRKGGSRDPLEFGSGTMGVVAKARSVIGVYRDPRDADRRLFARVKCNLAPSVPTLACRFDSDTPDSPLRVEWLGEDPRSAADIMAEIHQANAGSKKDPSRARRALVEWLRDGQWKAVAQLKALAEETELSWKVIEKAKNEIGVLHESRPGVGWCWQDPWSGSRQQEVSTL